VIDSKRGPLAPAPGRLWQHDLSRVPALAYRVVATKKPSAAADPTTA
jgi:hypothetical protein